MAAVSELSVSERAEAFKARLRANGPESDGTASCEPPTMEAAEAFCRGVAAGHGENFPVGLRLMPRRLRQPMANVYAFCRWADDLGDETGDAAESLRLLAWWRGETTEAFAGRPRHPITVALSKTAAEFGLTEWPFADLISAFEQDQTVTKYESHAGLLDYCTRSANPVGRIVLRLCDADTDRHVELSDQVCTGLQLVNFWQDVARDAAMGRRYLPADRMAEAGYTDAMWQAGETNESLRTLGESLVTETRDEFLSAGETLCRGLRGRVRAVVGCFHRGGLLVARKIERQKFDLWRRPAVSKADLAAVAMRATAEAAVGRRSRGRA